MKDGVQSNYTLYSFIFFFIFVLFWKPPKERGENNDYLISGEVLHKVKTLEKAQAADGGSYGPPCMQLFLMGIAACAYIESNFIRSNRT